MAIANRLALSVFVVLSVAAFAAAQSYSVVNLGTGVATALNNNGYVVVGNSIRIPPHTQVPLTGLGDPEGINIHGVVVGTTDLGATVWTNGVLLGLGALSGDGDSSYSKGINASGQVVGGSGGAQAFLWSQATGMQGLGFLPGGGFSSADAINRFGEVVGYANATDGFYGFFWSETTGMQQLASLACGSGGNAFSINDLHQIVGYSVCGIGWHAVLWNNSQSSAQDLGALPGLQWSTAHSINNRSQVVGVSFNSRSQHAFLWTAANGLQDLNNLIPAGSGWLLQSATAINDKGHIIGYGTFNGVTHAFLLTPQ